MRYRPDILALYGDLFRETQDALEKQAGVASALGRAVERVAPAGNPILKGLQWIGRRFRRVPKAVPGVWSPVATSAAVPAAESAATRVSGAGVPPTAAVAPAAAEPAVGPTLADVIAGGSQSAARARRLGLLAALGIPAAGAAGYALGRPSEADLEAARIRGRNIAFGAGTAAGLTAPFIIRGLGQIAGSMYGQGPGLVPGAYPSLVPGQGY